MLLRLREDGKLLEEEEFRQLFVETNPVPEVITKEVADDYKADIVVETPVPESSLFFHVSSEVKLDESGNWRKVWTVVEITDPAEREALQLVFEAQLTKDVKSAVQKLLDTEAQKREYDTIHTAALRAAYPGPFHDEGVQYASWMDACWVKCYEILKQVKANERPIPTKEEVVAEMPSFDNYSVVVQ